MPRHVPIHWEGEQAVLQHRAEDVWEKLQPLRKIRTKVMTQVLSSPEYKLYLIGICQDHLTSRDQKTHALETAAGNKQLKEIAAKARTITPLMPNVPGAILDLQGKIAGLASGPGYMLIRHLRMLGSDLELYTGIDAIDADWSLLAAACDASLSKKRGRLKDLALRLTVKRLIKLYECATGTTFTHNPTDRGEYRGRLYSECDRFVYAVMQTIEPGVHETLICTYLQEVKELRSAKAKAGRGGAVQSS